MNHKIDHRRGVGPGAWHASQALKAVLWAAAVIGLGVWGAVELAAMLLWGAP